MPEPNSTVKEITRRREALKVSKSALSREAEMHVSTVSLIENGRLAPYPSQLRKMKDALDRLEAARNRGR